MRDNVSFSIKAASPRWDLSCTDDLGDIARQTTLSPATKTTGDKPVWMLGPGLLKENPAFGASVIGNWETGAGLNSVFGKDAANILADVGSVGAYKSHDGRSCAAQAYPQYLGMPDAEHFSQSRHERRSVGLMPAIFKKLRMEIRLA